MTARRLTKTFRSESQDTEREGVDMHLRRGVGMYSGDDGGL